MATTYTPIATTTLGANALTVTFSSIPSTYTDLILVTNEKQTGSRGASGIQFNGDTAVNYSYTSIYGNGTSALSNRQSNDSIYYNYATNADSTDFDANAIVHIMNYANTTTYKTVLARGNNATKGSGAYVGLWRSTAAITSFRLWMDNISYFTAGSTFTLYGIKAA